MRHQFTQNCSLIILYKIVPFHMETSTTFEWCWLRDRIGDGGHFVDNTPSNLIKMFLEIFLILQTVTHLLYTYLHLLWKPINATWRFYIIFENIFSFPYIEALSLLYTEARFHTSKFDLFVKATYPIDNSSIEVRSHTSKFDFIHRSFMSNIEYTPSISYIEVVSHT